MLKNRKTRENSREHEPAEANKTEKTKNQRQNLRKLEPAEAEKTRKVNTRRTNEKTRARRGWEPHMKLNKRENRENSSQRSTALLKLTRTKRREKNCSKTLCSSRVSLWPPGFVHPCSEHGYARVHACIICTYAYMYRRRERETHDMSPLPIIVQFFVWFLFGPCPPLAPAWTKIATTKSLCSKHHKILKCLKHHEIFGFNDFHYL